MKFTDSLCPTRTFPWNLNATQAHIGGLETTLEVAVKAILFRMQQGERVWAAELVFRLSGLGLLGACRSAVLWLMRMVRIAPPHQATPAEFALAVAGFVCLTSGLGLLLEGPGLLRLMPRPPRALLP